MTNYHPVARGEVVNWPAGASIAPDRDTTARPSTKKGSELEVIVLDFLKKNLDSNGNGLLPTLPNYPIYFSVRSIVTDNQDAHAVRVRELYRNIPVFGAELVVHLDPYDNIIRVNGNYFPNINLNVNEHVSDTSQKLAVDSALKDAGSRSEKILNFNPILEIYPTNENYYLVWHLKLKGLTRKEKPALWEYFVDANTAEVIFRYNNLQTVLSSSQGKGEDMKGNPLRLNTAMDNQSRKYFLVDMSRQMYPNGEIRTHDYQNNAQGTQCILPNRLSSTSDDDWNKTKDLTEPATLHDYMGIVYQYFLTTHLRDSYNGSGKSINAIARVGGKDSDNAYWDPNCEIFVFGSGNGSSTRSWVASLDIVGHEFTHAVTSFTAGLIYADESGALNESFSDVFGKLIDNGNWLIGKAITISGSGLRDLQDPTRGKIYDKTDDTDTLEKKGYPQPDHYLDYWPDTNRDDNGGVHINSGIPNKAAYLIIRDLRIPDASRIYYRALTHELTSSSRFSDLRPALLQACADEFPGDTIRRDTIDKALRQVGL